MRAEKQTETLATLVVINKLIEINNAFSQIIWLSPSTLTSSFLTVIHRIIHIQTHKKHMTKV